MKRKNCVWKLQKLKATRYQVGIVLIVHRKYQGPQTVLMKDCP